MSRQTKWPPALRRDTRLYRSIAVTLTIAAHSLPCLADETASSSKSAQDRVTEAHRLFEQAVAIQNHESPAAQQLYAKSLELFESAILDGIENGHLHYNAGNAALRLGRIGHAIVHFKRAEDLIPADNDLARNLAFARRLCALQIAPKPSNAILDTLLFWYHGTSTRSRWTVTAIAYIAFSRLLLLRLKVRRRSATLVATTSIAAVIAIAVGASVAFDVMDFANGREGVVTQNDTVIRKGNGEGYQPQLATPLPDGVEFSIIEIRDSADGNRWFRIELPDGTDGWINAERAILI